MPPTTSGSEYVSEEFTPEGRRFRSLGEMASTLSFAPKQPKAPEYDSYGIPTIPEPPVWPSIPGIKPTIGVRRCYISAFKAYLSKWEKWHRQMAGHLCERSNMTSTEGTMDPRVLNREVEFDIGIRGDDMHLRKAWTEGCDGHDRHLEEYSTILRRWGDI